MTEVYEHNLGDHEDPMPTATWMVGLIGAVSLVIILLGLTALYYNTKAEEYSDKHKAMVPETLQEMRARQRQYLEHWWKADEGERYGMPVDVAMENYVNQVSRTGSTQVQLGTQDQ